jgi:hypothetical protein
MTGNQKEFDVKGMIRQVIIAKANGLRKELKGGRARRMAIEKERNIQGKK